MLADTFTSTRTSLAGLTGRCIELGGFRHEGNGSIKGVFHRPLLQLAMELGFDGVVEGHLTSEVLKHALDAGKLAVLSIDLARVRPELSGGHLLLVHSYDAASKEFSMHDCSEVLSIPGASVRLGEATLARISNRKGLVLWPRSLGRKE